MESTSLLDGELCEPSLEPLRSSTLASALLFMNSKRWTYNIDEFWYLSYNSKIVKNPEL